MPPENLEALAEVKQRVRVPIAAGERLYSRWEYQRFFQLRCADYIQPDLSHMGGIGEVKMDDYLWHCRRFVPLAGRGWWRRN